MMRAEANNGTTTETMRRTLDLLNSLCPTLNLEEKNDGLTNKMTNNKRNYNNHRQPASSTKPAGRHFNLQEPIVNDVHYHHRVNQSDNQIVLPRSMRNELAVVTFTSLTMHHLMLTILAMSKDGPDRDRRTKRSMNWRRKLSGMKGCMTEPNSIPLNKERPRTRRMQRGKVPQMVQAGHVTSSADDSDGQRYKNRPVEHSRHVALSRHEDLKPKATTTQDGAISQSPTVTEASMN